MKPTIRKAGDRWVGLLGSTSGHYPHGGGRVKLRTVLEIATVVAGSVTVVGAVLVVRGVLVAGWLVAGAGFVAGVALRLWERRVWRREVREAQERARRIRMEET